MHFQTIASLLALSGAANAFRDSSPWIFLSTSPFAKAPSADQIQSSSSVLSFAKDVLSTCPTDRYLVVSQPGLNAADLRRSNGCAMPHLCQAVEDSRINGKAIVSEVVGDLAGAGLSEYIKLACAKIEGIIDCMVEQGKVKSREEAYKRIWMLDQHGLIGNPNLGTSDGTKPPTIGLGDRANLDERQLCYLKKDMHDRMNLEDVVKAIKPTVILGLSGAPGVFTEGAIRAMADGVEKPVVFPLSNPTHQSECTAEQAFKWTDGRAIFASGSPFKDVEYKGKICKVNQINNAMSFPGLGLGVTVSRSSRVTGKMFMETAITIANMASEEQLKSGILFPGVAALREVSKEVAARVCEVAYDQGLARAQLPQGVSLKGLIEESMWKPAYVPTIRLESHP